MKQSESYQRSTRQNFSTTQNTRSRERNGAPGCSDSAKRNTSRADIWLKTAGRQFAFQVVEVMEPERRRGAEYKALAGGLARGFGYDTERGRIDGPQWIANAVAQKAAKKYADAEQLNLLVYANFSAHQLQHVDVVNTARTYFPAFASIWVVTNLWLGSLNVSNQLGRIGGWGIIFTPEQYLRDQAG